MPADKPGAPRLKAIAPEFVVPDVVRAAAAAAPGTVRRCDEPDAYIWVDDVNALYAEFRGRGADIVEGPVDRIYGRREIVVRDQHGFRIAFGQ